ncbi:hypothetical protein BCV69DRAFT_313605 [Microstroma glucosiphilum]|uniref:Uncharacterized protein n=1 Tax=Pseudomicrostroma glucosiphilum TaxID=1684307 RepID=A0A316U3K3_9BASI|nr:hypothetical protein BCV69DRAFT_313605 [Pseudomicrostroma glucosiphilum]PWN19869.1 hypothetical protein BCV69DRAFT_313605 [Pseudomicrostroma glucosiphilum]
MSGIAAQWRRRRPDAAGILGVAAATITLAGVSWYWYNRWATSTSSSSRASSSSGTQQQSGSVSDVHDSKSLARRPSLSISFPPHFDLTLPSHQEHLLRLYRSLSPLYLITLLHFSPHGGSELGRLTSLLQSQIVGADTRRIVPYSTTAGASAVARALGCDAHLEVYAEGHSRSLSPMAGTKADLLARTQALGLIRKNGKCRLVVVALLPAPALPADQPKIEHLLGTEAGDGDESDFELDLDSLVNSLLNPGSTSANGLANGHKDSNGSASSGEKAGATLRIIDTRTSTDPTSPRRMSFGSEDKAGREEADADAKRQKDRESFDKAVDEVGSKMRELRRAWK